MATSGVITGLLTVRQMLTEAGALCSAKLVTEGQPALTAYDAARGLTHLNLLLKSAQNDGCHAFLKDEINITWPGGEAEQILDTNTLDIYEMRVRDSNDVDRQLTRVETDEYRLISNKLQEGAPNTYSLGKTISTLIVRLWPVPSADVELYATVKRVIEDTISLDDNVDAPQEWMEAIIYKMATRYDRLSGMSGTPEAQELARAAEGLYQLAKTADEPESLFLAPY